MRSRSAADEVLDVLGVGFGPANLAVAVALRELAPELGFSFRERQPRFGWHRGMLLPGATLQVSFLKDIVTMRNPLSDFGFVAYLHARKRLPDFINQKTLFPSRIEYHDYLEWCAERLAPFVHYGCEITEVRPVVENGVIRYLDVVGTAGGRQVVNRTRNIVIGAGMVPVLPPGVVSSDRVWHTEELLSRGAAGQLDGIRRVVVVGAGQSGAEAAAYLHQVCPEAEIHAVFARYGYSVADDSPFANRIFDPAAVDAFYTAPDDVRRSLMRYHANTNYSVVDLELVEDLYRSHYAELVGGTPRLHIANTSAIRDLHETGDGVELGVEHLPTGSHTRLHADMVVFATGYRPADPRPLLRSILSECKVGSAGQPLLERDFRLVTSNVVECGIYLHGAAAEASHGLSSGLLSTVAVRAGEIAGSILDRNRERTSL